VLADPNLKRTIMWSSQASLRQAGHRPDLMVRTRRGLLAVEVELQRKSTSRMRGIASMYRSWINDGEIAGVLYVCASDRLVDHVQEHVAHAGIGHGSGLWIELLDQIRQEARDGAGAPRGAQAAPVAGAVG
jgi:hypothetical protein